MDIALQEILSKTRSFQENDDVRMRLAWWSWEWSWTLAGSRLRALGFAGSKCLDGTAVWPSVLMPDWKMMVIYGADG